MDDLRTIIKSGAGLYRPNDRAKVTVTVVCSDSSGKIVLSKERHQFVLGEPENQTWHSIEKCILNMREGQEIKSTLSSDDSQLLCHITLVHFERAVDFWRLSADQKLSLAGRYKAVGNEQFKKGSHKMAAMFYSKSLKYIISMGANNTDQQTELKLACLGNLAACQLKLCHYNHCITNCTKILKRQPLNGKALFRRGSAYLGVRELELAETDLLQAKQVEPDSPAIVNQLKNLHTAKEKADKEYRETMKKMFGGTQIS